METTLDTEAEIHFVDRLLLDSKALTAEISNDQAHPRLTQRLLLVIAGSMAIYGVSIGLPAGIPQAMVAAIKLPLVLLVAAGLSLPLLHVGCALVGHRVRLDQLSAHVLQALATASVTMAGLAPFIVVGWLTLSGGEHASDWWVYRRVVLAGIAVAGVGGLAGAARLLRPIPLRAAAPWTIGFGCAGLQLSWLVRPIVGQPETVLVVFRPLESNALTEVFTALLAVLG